MSKKSNSKIAIQVAGLSIFLMGASMAWNVFFDPYTKNSFTGYYFSIFIGVPLTIIGWRMLMRRYWSGVSVIMIFIFYTFNWISSYKITINYEDFIVVAFSIFVLISLRKHNGDWVRKI